MDVIERAAYLGVDELKKSKQCDLGDDASKVTGLGFCIVFANVHLVN